MNHKQFKYHSEISFIANLYWISVRMYWCKVYTEMTSSCLYVRVIITFKTETKQNHKKQQQYSRRLWRLNDAWLVLRAFLSIVADHVHPFMTTVYPSSDATSSRIMQHVTKLKSNQPKCVKKISPTPLHHHYQPEPLRQGRMIHAFMFFTPNSDPTSECSSRNQNSSDQATFLQSCIVQFCLRVLFLSDRSGTRCGLLLLESICFRVRRVVCSEMYFV